MKPLLKVLLMLGVLFILSWNSLSAQFNDYSIKFGLQGNGLIPNTEFTNDNLEIAFTGRAFLRFELSKAFEVELGAGYGRLAGDDFVKNYWRTDIIPLDLRLILSPFDLKGWNPYAYGGAGYLKWDVKDKPASVSPFPGVKNNGWDVFVPVGLGIEFALSDNVLLDISGGFNQTFTDDINFYNNKDVDNSKAYDAYWSGGLGLTFTGESGSSDKDLDGLTKNQEEELKTDPNNSDTDGDGLLDGEEFLTFNTDPLNPDTDKDGLTDSEETKKYKTDPNSKDSDSDGLSDYDELMKYKTNPMSDDTDIDGLKDGEEIKLNTNPNNKDTDNDGLTDYEEIKNYKTNPTNPDTDGDGLKDGEEIRKHSTNPLKKDTDGGTVDDKTEVDRGTNPLNPNDDVVLDVSKPIILEGVTFASGKADLTPESEKVLMKALNTLNAYPDMKVEIRGYTDSRGSAKANKKLSLRRANAVRNWLLSKGIEPSRVIAKGYGEANPIANNSTPEGRRLNRRIEFVKITK